ncbi:MAG: hypothetical protein RJA94_893 [Pseudomonadota bacterium]|jgi:hypothetical protein
MPTAFSFSPSAVPTPKTEVTMLPYLDVQRAGFTASTRSPAKMPPSRTMPRGS